MTYTCPCCGKVIEPGPLTDVQFAAVDALCTAIAGFKAASEHANSLVDAGIPGLPGILRTSEATVDRLLALLALIQASATTAQNASIRETLDHAVASLAPVKPS